MINLQKIATLPVKNIREIEDRTKPRSARTYSLAHLKVGLHTTPEACPSWQYALIDSGASDNLVSLNALKHLSDFNKIQIQASGSRTMITANNDDTQCVEGSVVLLMSVIDKNGERICFRINFLVVSGLTYEMFLGQPFLTSNQINHETRDSLFFNPRDCMKFNSPVPPTSKTSPALLEVHKTYHSKRRATAFHRTLMPAHSAQKVSTNLAQVSNISDDIFYSFRPSEQFVKNYPELHIMHQTHKGSNKQMMRT